MTTSAQTDNGRRIVRCTFPPQHPEACDCLREPCDICGHRLGGHDESGCRITTGVFGDAASMVPCICHRTFDRAAYLTERGLPVGRSRA